MSTHANLYILLDTGFILKYLELFVVLLQDSLAFGIEKYLKLILRNFDLFQ